MQPPLGEREVVGLQGSAELPSVAFYGQVVLTRYGAAIKVRNTLIFLNARTDLRSPLILGLLLFPLRVGAGGAAARASRNNRCARPGGPRRARLPYAGC